MYICFRLFNCYLMYGLYFLIFSQEIDEAIMHAKAQGYRTILQLGARGVDYARYVIMQTAIKVSSLFLSLFDSSFPLPSMILY